jgi:hypothetical protein
MTDLVTDYNTLITSLRNYERILNAAHAVQHLAPAGGARPDPEARDLPANPTLDIVMDPRRDALAQVVREQRAELREISQRISANTHHLTAALALWQGK